LAHVENNKVRATYNKALLLNERKEIMQTWAEYLESARSEGMSSNG